MWGWEWYLPNTLMEPGRDWANSDPAMRSLLSNSTLFFYLMRRLITFMAKIIKTSSSILPTMTPMISSFSVVREWAQQADITSGVSTTECNIRNNKYSD